MWTLCKDKMPERGKNVIGYDIFYGRVGEAETGYAGQLVFVDSQQDDCKIIAWMPLPEPPPGEMIPKDES